MKKNARFSCGGMRGTMSAAALLMCLTLAAHSPIGTYRVCATDSVARGGRALHTVEVTAKRDRVNPRTTATQSLDREQMTRQGITNLTDALRRMNGAQVRDYGGIGGMKTLSVRSMGATHTAVVYDGVAVTDCESGQIDLSRFSLEQLDALSLSVDDEADIFVPARTVASAATLRLHTYAPRFDEGRSTALRALLRTGAFGLANGFLRLDRRILPSWSVRAQGEYLRADNRYPFRLVNGSQISTEKRQNNRTEAGHGEVNVYYAPADRPHRFTAKSYYYASDKQLPGAVVLYNPVNHEEQQFRNFFQQLHFRTTLSRHWAVQSHAKFNWNDLHYSDVKKQYSGGRKDNYYRQAEYYLSAGLLYTPLPRLSLSAVADVARASLHSRALDCEAPARTSLLTHFAAKYRAPWFTATAGLLYSLHENDTKSGPASQDGHRWSPSVGVTLHHPALPWLTARASYKDIFRMPTFADNYFDQMGRRDLKPEKARQLNVGLTLTAPRLGALENAELRVDAYRGWMDDKIVAMPVTSFYWSMVNVGKSELWGAETALQSAWTLWPRRVQLETSLSYSYQYAVNVTDPASEYYRHQLAYTPRHSGALSLALLTPWLNLSWHATGMSQRYFKNENRDVTRLAPYQEMGLSAWRRFPLPHHQALEVRAELLNLTDESYDVMRRYPMPGRSWKLTLIYQL